MKHLEGKDVFLIPTGNNAIGKKKGEYIKAHIIKVARVFVTFTTDNFPYEHKYRMMDDRYIGNEYNGGYRVFENEQEIKDTMEAERIASLISNKYRWRSDYERLDLKTIEKVADLLKVVY